jgi:hypothetical protein
MERDNRFDRPALYRAGEKGAKVPMFDQLVGFENEVQFSRERAIKLGMVGEEDVPVEEESIEVWTDNVFTLLTKGGKRG